jgi:hypothetical protein
VSAGVLAWAPRLAGPPAKRSDEPAGGSSLPGHKSSLPAGSHGLHPFFTQAERPRGPRGGRRRLLLQLGMGQKRQSAPALPTRWCLPREDVDRSARAVGPADHVSVQGPRRVFSSGRAVSCIVTSPGPIPIRCRSAPGSRPYLLLQRAGRYHDRWRAAAAALHAVVDGSGWIISRASSLRRSV